MLQCECPSLSPSPSFSVAVLRVGRRRLESYIFLGSYSYSSSFKMAVHRLLGVGRNRILGIVGPVVRAVPCSNVLLGLGKEAARKMLLILPRCRSSNRAGTKERGDVIKKAAEEGRRRRRRQTNCSARRRRTSPFFPFCPVAFARARALKKGAGFLLGRDPGGDEHRCHFRWVEGESVKSGVGP